MTKNRQSIRLKNYDYSKSGLYFVTICTENRECLFGDVINDKMILNDVGKIVNDVLLTIPKRFDNVELDTFQIMPNHIHGIIIVVGARSSRPAGLSRPILGQIIGHFKYQSTKHINNLLGSENPTPTIEIKKIFQRNYYEHIIRNEIELNKIREYIKNNPLFWNQDINY